MTLYLRPLDLRAPAEAGPGARPLAGGPLRFAACEILGRDGPGAPRREIVAAEAVARRLGGDGPAVSEAADSLLARLSAPRPAFAGLALDRPQVMGVINVTPDSFSDGGDRFDPGRAVADGLALVEAGAALVDVGGESTRPGAAAVDPAEEARRVVPVVRALARQGVLVSIDTRHARVMAEALAAGAGIINDVTALAGDPGSLAVAAEAAVPVVLMHMQGEPGTMQKDPRYDDAALDVYDVLAARVAACEAAGIRRGNLAVDPGIGFGKTLDHNLQILDQLALYHGLGCALLLGVSRKGFIGRLSRGEAPKDRLAGSLAAALAGVARGVQILRVHDVAETVQAVKVWRAIAMRGSDDAGDA